MPAADIMTPESAVPDVTSGADNFFQLGIMHSTGRTGPADMIAAHKWFNIAAARGSAEALRLRREIASEMSEMDIAAAQRAAREWLGCH